VRVGVSIWYALEADSPLIHRMAPALALTVNALKD
jgi:hypothetical protein